MFGIAYAIILRKKNTCDGGIVNNCLGDIGDLLEYCPTLNWSHTGKLTLGSLAGKMLISDSSFLPNKRIKLPLGTFLISMVF